jgi:parallel beta-helix repeat protein
MNIVVPCPKSVPLLLLFVVAILLPQSVAAQATLSVVPTSVSVQATVGTDAPSQIVQVRKTGAGALKWTVVPPAGGWVTVSPTSGTNNGTLTLTFQTSGLAAQTQPYTTSFRVVSGTQSVMVSVAVTIVNFTPPPPPTLTITCPANISVASPNGSPVVVTYTVTTSGGNPPVNLTVTPTSGSSFSVGTTTVQASAQSQDGQTKSCSFTVTVTFSTSSDWTFCAAEGGFCAFTGTRQVRYGANGSYFYKTLSDGTACTNSVFGDPIVGVVKECAISTGASTDEWTFCAFENQTCVFTGTTEVRFGANGSYAYRTLTNGTPCTVSVFGDPIFGIVKQCYIKFSNALLPTSSWYGTSPSITCPAGAVDILPGQSIQLIVNSNIGSTTFCLRAGVHSVTSSIRPKTGNAFVGEYGAILDGTGWMTTDGTQAAFRVYDDPNDPNDPNDPIQYVTIRNLVIRNMPEYGIHAFYQVADHWTIEYNEIASNKFGVLFGPDFTIRNNYIHHNIGTSGPSAQLGGAYIGVYAHNTTFDSNEIANNGTEQKVAQSTNVTFRNNFVHFNSADGIWYDTNPNAGALIEGNRVEDNARNGIFIEASVGATIRNNTLRRNLWDGVMVSMSQNAQIYNNSLEANVGGIDYFLNCGALSGGDDVKNNAAYDNTVVVGTQSDTYASGFTSTSTCTSTQLAPYLNGSKNLTFSRNAYRVPSLSFVRYFLWGGWKDWSQWQLVPQDSGGSISQ